MAELTVAQDHQRALTCELYVFLMVSTIASAVYGSYYSIFLYQRTWDLRVLVVDSLLVGISTWAGYVLGTFWIHRSGYVNAMRLSFAVSLLAALLTLVFISQVRILYPLFSLLRGLPGGIYAAVLGSYLLKELRKRERNDYYFLSLSFNLAVGIVLPLAVGAVVTFLGGFRMTFALAAILYGAGLLLPMRYNKRPQSDVSLAGVVQIARLPHFREFSINRIMVNGADQLNAFLLAIVPYLIIKTVFGVGALSSGIAIVSAATALLARHLKLKRQIELGYAGTLGRIAGNVALVLSWSSVGLVLRSLIIQVLSIFTDPISSRINIENMERLLGTELNKKALEVDLIDATLLLAGQVLALGIFLLILTAVHGHNISLLKAVVLSYAFWKLVNYAWIQRLHDELKRRLIRRPAVVPVLITERK